MDLQKYIEIENYIRNIPLVDAVQQERLSEDDIKEYIKKIPITNPFYGKSLAEVIFQLERESGKKPSEVYMGACVDKSVYSTLCTGKVQRPSKKTALGLGLGFHLSLERFKHFIEYCGYPFPADERDQIVQCIIEIDKDYIGKDASQYPVVMLDGYLADFKQPIIGETRKYERKKDKETLQED